MPDEIERSRRRLERLEQQAAEERKHLADLLRAAEAKLTADRADVALHSVAQPDTVRSEMRGLSTAHKAALSRAASRARGNNSPFLDWITTDEPDPNKRPLRKAKPQVFTAQTLAAVLGISQSTVFAHLKEKGDVNSRSIPEARALRIQALTGYPADEKHWLCGISKRRQ